MRITGGDFRGRTFSFPAGSKERPTSDFLREALFNLLGSLQGKRFLDLFAGSGSVGIEAASRGADDVLLIEKNKKLAAAAAKNIKLLSLEERCKVVCAEAERALKDLAKKKYRADIIFADPPYNKNMVDVILNNLSVHRVMAEEGEIVVQHSVKEVIKEKYNEVLFRIKQKIYGENALTFFQENGNESG